jgi:hypothetical protein
MAMAYGTSIEAEVTLDLKLTHSGRESLSRGDIARLNEVIDVCLRSPVRRYHQPCLDPLWLLKTLFLAAIR